MHLLYLKDTLTHKERWSVKMVVYLGKL